MLIMDNRIALVTGGSSGIGRSLCLNLAMDGYRVFSVSRSKKLASDMNHITQITADLSIPDKRLLLHKNFFFDMELLIFCLTMQVTVLIMNGEISLIMRLPNKLKYSFQLPLGCADYLHPPCKKKRE